MSQPSLEFTAITATPLAEGPANLPAMNALGGRPCAPRGHVIVPVAVCDTLPTPACQACLQQGCPSMRTGPA